jgi:hypothetical protein
MYRIYYCDELAFDFEFYMNNNIDLYDIYGYIWNDRDGTLSHSSLLSLFLSFPAFLEGRGRGECEKIVSQLIVGAYNHWINGGCNEGRQVNTPFTIFPFFKRKTAKLVCAYFQANIEKPRILH